VTASRTTTNSVEITTATLTTPDLVIEQAAGLIIADGYIPNGIAFDPTYAWTIATSRYADGRKKYPELGFGSNVTSFEGLNAYSSTTVSACSRGVEHERQGDRGRLVAPPLGCAEAGPGRAHQVR
jgi:hypothetical protein